MAIYGISDLHLSFGVDKPMNVFGKTWQNYEEKIKENWINTVKEEDYVIIAGDISWGMHLSECKKDFEFIHSLPGNKIILKGNHDYYFQSKTKLENFLKSNNMNEFSILQNNAYIVNDTIICGTRGWGEVDNKELDTKLIAREALRIKLTLDAAMKLKNENPNARIIFAMHFPPFLDEFQRIINEYPIDICVYGHLHGFGHTKVKEGIIDGIEYKMIGCDYTGFKLVSL